LKKQISVKWKIGSYLLFFSGFILVLLFIFQMLLLEPMYERSKANTIESVADMVEDIVGDSNANEEIMNLALQTDTCIQTFTNNSVSISGKTGINGGCAYSVSTYQINEFVAQAIDNGGSYLTTVEGSRIVDDKKNSDDHVKNMIYTKVINDDNTQAIIIVSGMITPLSATRRTLSYQLLYIGLILFMCIGFLTIILYKKIANPITSITKQAKSLSKGEYSVDEKTNLYLEAQELNETLSKASEDIKQADKAKTDLIANVSHDLRTPLTMIKGYGEMMIDLPEEKTDENIKVIVDEATRLNNLVNDLLDLSKLQENKITLNKEVTNITQLVKQEMRKYDVYVMKDGFNIEQEYEGDYYANIDVKRIGQVFNNFMINAINYSGNKKYIIVRVLKHDNKVRIEVQDHGEGIEEDKLDKVWDRYYKIDKEHVRVSNGSGIGLSLCRQILELHQVNYGVNSKLHEGSTFWCEFDIEEDVA